jgi:AraC-like DNA-binding protein
MRTAHKKCYLRDGVPALTLEGQVKLLTDAGVDMSYVYEDRMTKAAIKRRDPAALKQRDLMLAPTSRKDSPETIYVAGLRVLGWDMRDIARALAAAGRRTASVFAVDTGTLYDHTTLDAVLLEGLAAADTARRKGQTLAGRTAGQAAAQAKALKKRTAALKAAYDDWIKPDHEVSGAEISRRVGLSRRTLHTYLGPRGEARANAERKKNHV